MEDNKNKPEVQVQETVHVSYKEKNEESSLASSLEVLSKFGGFNFLESTVDGIQNLNPERKARKKIFLTDEQKQEELKNKIDMWIDLLNSLSDMSKIIGKSYKNSVRSTRENGEGWVYNDNVPFYKIESNGKTLEVKAAIYDGMQSYIQRMNNYSDFKCYPYPKFRQRIL